ncbi:MAG: transposase [Oscillospiraceae bacterium]|jgi:hypothetical protein|nr:transposase [Oscillospiraceae bacterium]
MRKKYVQMSLLDTWHSVEERLENDKPGLFRLLDEHLDWDEIIPDAFYRAFYLKTGRKRKYELESFMRALFLQRIFHYVEDSQLLATLRFSYEMREFCGFSDVPDASKLTRFKQDFCDHLRAVFERLVDLTEPICREMDKTLADTLLFDTTGIESYVAENNPKFLRGKEAQAKSIAKIDPAYDASLGGVALLPKVAASNPTVKQQYINGHFCYAQKAVVVTNGLGIVRHLEFLDEDFKRAHPEIEFAKRTNNPELDKEIGDSIALQPVLRDFRECHPSLRYGTFSADAAFDKFDHYKFLLDDYGFRKAVIPLNPRHGLSATDIGFNELGTPLCPRNGTPFTSNRRANDAHRSPRLKFVCPGARRVGTTMQNRCEMPCSPSKYGRVAYVHLNKNFRLYPGISREEPAFAEIYNRRVAVERTIYTLKDTLGLANRKTSNTLTTKADLFLAGIVQLLCVLLAGKLHNLKLARSPRRLIA